MTLESRRWRAIASDFDGTLTGDAGRIDATVLDALQRIKASGRKLLLVTGRVLEDLFDVCPAVNTFDRIVAENGAVIHRPSTAERRRLADPPDRALVDRLERDGVRPLSCGQVIVATVTRHEAAVAAAIGDLHLDVQIILNKGSLMVLPCGIDKASGLAHALAELGISPADTVGIGDAENDDCLLATCGFGIAVADAVPALKVNARLVTTAPGGRGVLEVIEAILAAD